MAVDQLKGHIDDTRHGVEALVARLDKLEDVHRWVVREFTADPDLLAAFASGGDDSGKHGPGGGRPDPARADD